MAAEQGLGASEDFQNLCLLGVHFRERWRLQPGVPKGFFGYPAREPGASIRTLHSVASAAYCRCGH